MRRVDLLHSGDQLGMEHVPRWRGRQCPGPSFGALATADHDAPAPTDYAVGLAEGYRQAVEVVQTAFRRVKAEQRPPRGVPSDRRGRLVALGELLSELLERTPR